MSKDAFILFDIVPMSNNFMCKFLTRLTSMSKSTNAPVILRILVMNRLLKTSVVRQLAVRAYAQVNDVEIFDKNGRNQ